ncbi:hypothetical protein OIE68_01375 [Nocardia vinacea]|uniref:hypothetical protein n=1 Tax=Nocardia vinacea TaxID=96468 RepID=UPI002E14E41B|nr:hypothetical protein OIE68_01375 [Nocardia vinacea]
MLDPRTLPLLLTHRQHNSLNFTHATSSTGVWICIHACGIAGKLMLVKNISTTKSESCG